jgi:hypothetical protein
MVKDPVSCRFNLTSREKKINQSTINLIGNEVQMVKDDLLVVNFDLLHHAQINQPINY